MPDPAAAGASAPEDHNEAVAAAMADRGFYGSDVDSVEVCETHVSWVFLAGERAFKLRKALVLPFLDYGTLERRRELAGEEVRLGRRLAPDLYGGVRSVCARAGGFKLGEPDDPAACEYVVEMRRFDEANTLAALLESDGAQPALIAQLGRRIAAFHASAALAPAASGAPGQVARTVFDNLAGLMEFAETVGAARLAAAARFAGAFIHGERRLFGQRAAEGRIRDCHGDLRTEHVIVEGERLEVCDPLEFDPGLRLIDVSSDLAFLAMELAERGRDELAELLVREYRAGGGDDGGDQLLAFYATHRAWVRAKVACVRAGELEPGARREAEERHADRLAGLAEQLSWRARGALLLVVCGAAATGKTRLSEALAARSGLTHLNSDVVRKQLAGLAPDERAPLSLYSEEFNLETYRELARRAGAQPRGAIVDATFRRRADRDAFSCALDGAVPSPLFVECHAPASVVAERARRRELDTRRASDATAAIAARQAAEFEALDEVDPGRHLMLRTDQATEATLDEIIAWLDLRLARAD